MTCMRHALLILIALSFTMTGGFIPSMLMTLLVLTVLYQRGESRRWFGTSQ